MRRTAPSAAFNNAGTFYWQAVHSGDANINGAASVCTSQTLVVNPNTTSMSTAQNLLPNDDASLSGDDQHRHRDDHVQPVQPDRFHLLGIAGTGVYSTTNTAFLGPPTAARRGGR